MIQQRRTCRPSTLIILLVCIIATSFSRPLSADSARELQLAVHQLTIFLGSDTNAQDWRRYLDLNILETQAAKGDAANVNDLAAVLKRFNSDTPGLENPAFLEVKYALQRQIHHLSSSDSIDVYDAVAKSRASVTPISQAEIEYRRDRAIHDLKRLKNRYTKTLDEPTRNEVFEQLKPGELLQFLGGIKVEVPDFRTPESIQQEIETAKQGLAKIDEQLNALNQQMNQIQKWLKQLREKKSKQLGDGPVPDEQGGNRIQTASGQQKQDPVTQESVDKDKLKLESNLKTLEKTKQQLKRTIEQLKDDKENLEANEKSRMQRRNQIGRALNPYQRAFNDLQLEQRDVDFANANYSFSRFRSVFANGTDPRIKAAVETHLDTLLEYFENLSDPSNRQAQAEVGKALGNLDASNQATQLISAIRKAHSLPNLEVSVSRELINQVGGRTVSDTQAVRENILGRLILGEALVEGEVSIDLIPDPNQAHISLLLMGNVESDTYTKQGRITAYATGSAAVEARRSIFVNTSGLFVTDAYTAANLESSFKGISSRCRLVQRIAQKQYQKDKALSEGISASRLEAKTLNQFLEQTNEVLAEGQDRIDEFQMKRAMNLAFLPELFLTTTHDHFKITGIKSSPYDLAAPLPPQESADVPAGVSVRVNETALSNYGSQVLAGKAFWNYELAEKLETLLNIDMTNLREGENGDWQILFSDKRPVQFEFDNDRFSVVVTGLKFSQGQNTINYGLKIRLRFKIVRKDGQLFFERDGKSEIEYLTEEKDGKTVAFKTALERQLDKANDDGTAPEIPLPENLIPVDGELLQDVPLAKQLKLVQLRAVKGWLYLGWNYVAEGETYTGPINTPAIVNE